MNWRQGLALSCILLAFGAGSVAIFFAFAYIMESSCSVHHSGDLVDGMVMVMLTILSGFGMLIAIPLAGVLLAYLVYELFNSCLPNSIPPDCRWFCDTPVASTQYQTINPPTP
jgi:hypothetical protein